MMRAQQSRREVRKRVIVSGMAAQELFDQLLRTHALSYALNPIFSVSKRCCVYLHDEGATTENRSPKTDPQPSLAEFAQKGSKRAPEF